MKNKYFIFAVKCIAFLSTPLFAVTNSNKQEIVVFPCEMASSQIKDSLLADLQPESLCTTDQTIDFASHPISQKLSACLLMAMKDHAAARKLLEDNLCLAPEQRQILRNADATRKPMEDIAAEEGQRIRFIAHKLTKIVEALDVRPLNEHIYKRAGYATYYADKKENFSLEAQETWGPKQKNVLKILQELKPATILDIGANTGWFSRLAASLGGYVIATDIDESCVEYQYQAAKDCGFLITSLFYEFEKIGNDQESTRLEADVVLCLALIHHLVSVGNLDLEEIIEKLATVTKKTLVLEFVDLEDKTIQQTINDPTYFKDSKQHASFIKRIEYMYYHYNVENVLKISKKYFTHVKTLDSYPSSSRHLLILSKKGKEGLSSCAIDTP